MSHSTRPTQTQIHSIKKTRNHSGLVRELVYSIISNASEPITRTEVGNQLTELKMSSITARVHELIKLARIVVAGKKWDEETQRNVETLIVAPPVQYEK
jgi:hypothetical protein